MRAVIVPHAGHVYSGPTAGYAYASLDPARVDRVVLLGPAHYVPVDGIGSSSAGAWRTPLGEVPLDADALSELAATTDRIAPADRAHEPEHCLEVQLPFLQRVLDPGWTLVPLLVGTDLPEEVGALIARATALPGTLVVLSTDLSHYLEHHSAVEMDARTIAAVLRRDAAGIGPRDACGRYPLRGLLTAAAAQEWEVELLDARTSGDTAGDRSRVVGYAAFVLRGGPAGAGGAVDETGEDAASAPTVGTGPSGALAGSGPSGPGGSGPLAPTASAGPGPAGGADALPETGPHSAPVRPVRIGPAARAELLAVARTTIETALTTGRRVPANPDDWRGADPVLREPGAAFVTLRSASGDLLGCIGTLSAHQPLVRDVADHAYDAAFRDPRFPPLTRARAEGMVIDISVLSPTRPFPCRDYADLLARLPVGSGVVVTAGRRRGTFLPAVWEQLPGPAGFLAALWRKAGLAPGEWPRGISIEVYDSEEFAEPTATPNPSGLSPTRAG